MKAKHYAAPVIQPRPEGLAVFADPTQTGGPATLYLGTLRRIGNQGGAADGERWVVTDSPYAVPMHHDANAVAEALQAAWLATLTTGEEAKP